MWWFESKAKNTEDNRVTKQRLKPKRAPRLRHCPMRDSAAQAAIELALAQKILRSAHQ